MTLPFIIIISIIKVNLIIIINFLWLDCFRIMTVVSENITMGFFGGQERTWP